MADLKATQAIAGVLDRRRFLERGMSSLVGIGLLPLAAEACSAAQPQRDDDAARTPRRDPARRPPADAIDVVQRFGFVGDGRTDNYAAFHRWAGHANGRRGGNYLFPPGTYYVARYRNQDSILRRPGSVQNPTLRDCDGLGIWGSGAKILLNGRFHRSARRAGLTIPEGASTGIFMPFELRGCRNVTISGFEIDGGVRQMTRDAEVTEMWAHLVTLLGCSRVLLEDLHLHHGQADGIMLAGNHPEGRGLRRGIACRDVRINRVNVHNNARGALAPIQVLGLSCADSRFDGSHSDLGRYAGHAPGFGVDIEPDYSLPADIDTRTGNVEFVRCSFNDNISAFLAAYPDSYQGYLRILDCRSSNRHGHPHHIIINWPGALIEGGTHDAGAGTVWTSWQNQRGGHLTIRNCTIRTAAPYGVFHAFEGNLLEMERVRIVGGHREPAGNGWVLAIKADPGGQRRNRMRGCEIFIPGRRKLDAADYDYEISLAHIVSEANLFRTDLGAGRGDHFCTDYGTGAVAIRDRYRGTAPGPNDSFRPARSSQHDTRLPYSS